MMTNYWLLLLILFPAMFFSVKLHKLTAAGAFTGGIAGFFVYLGAGFAGVGMIGLFFLLGTLATAFKINVKEKLGAAERQAAGRTAGQVLANGGIAGMAGLLAVLFPLQREIFQVVMAASLASATADTLSSELGTLYGKKFYNIISLKPGRRGDNGVVSLEGTCIGIAGSFAIGTVYVAGFGWNSDLFLIVLAGTVGNISDSLLGATLESKGYLKNDAVNFLNTLVAGIFAWLFSLLA